MYVIWRRSAPYPSFVNFDSPDRASCVVMRPRTNTPLQALTLLNDPAYIEMAQALARRIATERSGLSIRERASYGFRLCVAREPIPEELDELEAVYRRELARFSSDKKAVAALAGNVKGMTDAQQVELAAWFFVANVLLNLDETITKG